MTRGQPGVVDCVSLLIHDAIDTLNMRDIVFSLDLMCWITKT